MALAMEHAAEEGVETIDMLRGEEAYKKLWHVESRSNLRLCDLVRRSEVSLCSPFWHRSVDLESVARTSLE